MNRRDALRLGSLTALGSMAGCNGLLKTRQVGRAPPVVEDRPDAVYVPSHVEGMQMSGMGTSGRRSVGLMYSFPHRFWTITGTRTKKVRIESEDTVHLMATVWDTETGMVLPVGAGVSFAIEKDGESIANRSPWPMLSQNMGFHYGDNVSLSGDGAYTVTVDVGAMNLRRTGAFEGQFGDAASVAIEFEYRESDREEISFERLDERKGRPGAVDPMEMQMPLSVAPPKEELPGDLLGEGESGDATFLATATEREGEPYLAVSPRTPHNRFVLPMMALSATIERSDRTVYDGSLSKAIDPELGYHYGAAVAVEPDDAVTVAVDAPPQVSRHEGYETAFVEMDAVTF